MARCLNEKDFDICDKKTTTDTLTRINSISNIDDVAFQPFQMKGSLGFDHRLYCKGVTGVDQEKQERFVRSESDAGEGDSSGSSSIDGENDLEEEEGKANSSDNGMWKVLMEEGGDILEELTPCDVRVLVHSEEELSQCETFERIFPTPDTGHYLQYIDTNYYDLLLMAWERRYAKDRQTGQDRLATLTEAVRILSCHENLDLIHTSLILGNSSGGATRG